MNAAMTRRASDAYDVLPSTDAEQAVAEAGLEFVPDPELVELIRAGKYVSRDRYNELDAERVKAAA